MNRSDRKWRQMRDQLDWMAAGAAGGGLFDTDQDGSLVSYLGPDGMQKMAFSMSQSIDWPDQKQKAGRVTRMESAESWDDLDLLTDAVMDELDRQRVVMKAAEKEAKP